MYTKPNTDQILLGIQEGLSFEEAERGYGIFDYDNTGLLEINRYDCVYLGWPDGYPYVTDEDCAKEAERTGFCKIIPVDELPENFDSKYFGWIDTPENRARINEYAQKYC